MKTLSLIAAILCIMAAAGCSREEEPAVMLIYHDGNEYTILDRGDSVENGYPAYFVRYYSENIGDASTLTAEQKDLCTIIAKHIDTNKHQRVMITAVERDGRLFGLLAPREITESMSADEVLKYHPARKRSADE